MEIRYKIWDILEDITSYGMLFEKFWYNYFLVISYWRLNNFMLDQLICYITFQPLHWTLYALWIKFCLFSDARTNYRPHEFAFFLLVNAPAFWNEMHTHALCVIYMEVVKGVIYWQYAKSVFFQTLLYLIFIT